MRKLVVVLVAVLVMLGLLLVVGDRLAARVAEDRAEERLAAEGFSQASVQIHGFPFLTQAVARRFRDVSVRAAKVQSGERWVEDADARLRDVRVPRQGPPRAGRLRARATVPYEEVAGATNLPAMKIAPRPDGSVRVSSSVQLLGRTFTVEGDARVQAHGDTLRVVPHNLQVTGGGPVDDAVSRLLADRVAFDYRLPDLPQGLQVERVTAGDDGFRVLASGRDVPLVRPADGTTP